MIKKINNTSSTLIINTFEGFYYDNSSNINIAKISDLADWNGAESNGYVIYPNNHNDVYLTLSDGTIRFDKKLNGDEQYKQIFGS